METPASYPELDRLLRHSDWLRALARRLVKDSSTAEDLVQETWLAAMKSPPDPNRPVRPWLAGVVRRLARMRARSEGRRARRQTVAARKDALPSTAALVEGVDTERRLAEVVVGLSEPYRTTVLLRYYHELSAAEISRRQDVPAGTVRWRLKRGLDELRERLDESYGARSTWCLAFAGLERTTELIAGTTASAATVQTLSFAALAKWSLAAIVFTLGIWIPVALKGGAAEPVQAARPEGGMALLDAEMPRGTADRENAVRAALIGEGESSPAVTVRALRVVEADGRPAAHTPAMLVLEDGSGVVGATDVDGVLELETPAQGGELWLDRAGAFFHRTPLVLDEAVRELRLPTGFELRGRLLVDGEPVADVNLEIDYDQHLFGGEALPAAVERAFGNGRRAKATTDADGRFRFHGLASSWSGELWLPPGFVVPGESRERQRGKALHVERPRTDLLIELERLPRVRGRVLSSGVPVPGAHVVCRADDLDSGGTFAAAADGTFDIQLVARGEGIVVVEVSAPDGGGWKRYRYGGEAAEAGFELGDLELAETTRVAYVARDVHGAPIAGATARQVDCGHSAAPSDQTGAGLAFLQGTRPREIIVTAPGYREVHVVLAGRQLPLDVVLESAASLELTVVDVDGRPLPSILVRLLVNVPPFEGCDDYKPGAATVQALVGVYRGSQAKPEGHYLVFLTDAEGRIVIPGLRDGIAVHAEVRDTLRRKVLEQGLGALEVGEQRALELRVPERLVSFAGRVLDEQGEILVGANVKIGPSGTRGPSLRSGLTGQFRFDNLPSTPFRLMVSKRGYAARVHEDYVVPGGPVDLRLSRGRNLHVVVRDPAGEDVMGGVLRVDSDAAKYDSGPYGDARQTVSDLPDAPIELVLELGGAEYRLPVDAGVDEVAFDVPAHGSAEVRWKLPAGEDGPSRFTLVAESTERGLAPIRVPLDGEARASGISVFPALLPRSYELRLERNEGKRPDGGLRAARPVGAAVPFTVEAGNETDVRITP